jgi:transposase
MLVALDTVSKDFTQKRSTAEYKEEAPYEKNKRLFPITEEVFNEKILPVIEGNYIRKGHPPEVSHDKAFCGILYILITGCPRRDLHPVYGPWHVIYDRFSRGNERELWAKVLSVLQKEKGAAGAKVIIDSTTMKVHRHGGGQKGGSKAKDGCERV